MRHFYLLCVDTGFEALGAGVRPSGRCGLGCLLTPI